MGLGVKVEEQKRCLTAEDRIEEGGLVIHVVGSVFWSSVPSPSVARQVKDEFEVKRTERSLALFIFDQLTTSSLFVGLLLTASA